MGVCAGFLRLKEWFESNLIAQDEKSCHKIEYGILAVADGQESITGPTAVSKSKLTTRRDASPEEMNITS